MERKNFKTIKGYIEFNQGCDKVLKDTLTEFFSASSVSIIDSPLSRLKEYGFDVTDNPKRNVYLIKKRSKVFLLSSVEEENQTYYLGVEIAAKNITDISRKRLFNITANAISNALKEASKSRFRKSLILLNENLIKRIIAQYISIGWYNPYKVYFLIEKLISIRDTTFEGKYFSTGLIVSKSTYLYENLPADKGTLHNLYSTYNLFAPVERRFWYLVDGYSSFYYSTLKSNVRSLLILNEESDNYLDKILLSNYLRGKDFLMRVHNGREMSFISSDGIEFLYQENTWRLRDYKWIKEQISSVIKISDKVYYALIFHVLNCSKNDISSIIWIPQDSNPKSIEKLIRNKSSLTRKKINIKEAMNESLVSRLLSSDGATVINIDGEVLYYGCIVDNNAIENGGVTGTGESAAKILAKNGIAFKISQDGMIKLFLNDRNHVIKF